MSDDKLITVYEGSPTDVDLLKSEFDANNIKCFIKDEIMGRLAPFYTSVGGVGAVKLIIPESELENAQPIVENFIKQWFLSKYYASLV